MARRGSRTAVNLLARLGRIRPLLITDERKALRPSRLAVFGQEDSRDAAESFEDLAQVLLFGEFRHLESEPSTLATTLVPHPPRHLL